MIIENLRLDDTNSDNTTGALAQGYNSTFIGLANPEAPWTTDPNAPDSDKLAANSLYNIDGSNNAMAITGTAQSYRFPRYNNDNTLNPSANATAPNTNIYSYGNYYTWPAAIADTGHYSAWDYSVTATSICPK